MDCLGYLRLNPDWYEFLHKILHHRKMVLVILRNFPHYLYLLMQPILFGIKFVNITLAHKKFRLIFFDPGQPPVVVAQLFVSCVGFLLEGLQVRMCFLELI